MNKNPWQVESIQEFVYLNCPECSFKTQEENQFQEHAVSEHPMCYVLFGESHIIVQEVNVTDPNDQKPEFFIEVKADEAPSKMELATALASIEEQTEDNTAAIEYDMEDLTNTEAESQGNRYIVLPYLL